MPELDYVWLPNAEILSFEEMSDLVDRFIALGVTKVRLTGGEPLIRRDLPELVRLLAAKPQLTDIALTTNGVLLADQAVALRDAGLHRVTVSIDTLKPDRFAALTRRDLLPQVLAGIDAARAAKFRGGMKLDTVVMRSVNDDEVLPLLGFAREVGAEIRFIEYMDVGGATRWNPGAVVSRAELLQRIGNAQPMGGDTRWAPAERFVRADGQVFGIIASTTAPFCGTCDRARVTADGVFYSCLYSIGGTDLKSPLRRGTTAAELESLIGSVWHRRTDRGAEERLKLYEKRAALTDAQALRANPHLEMHTRGG